MRENLSGRAEDTMPGDVNDSDGDAGSPYDREVRIRILDIQDRRPIGHEIQCITEPSLHIVRSRIIDSDAISTGDCIDLPSEVVGPMSEVRLKDLSGTAQQELVSALSASISADKERHLSFYNSAGHVSQVPLFPAPSRNWELQGNADGQSSRLFRVARVRGNRRILWDRVSPTPCREICQGDGRCGPDSPLT